MSIFPIADIETLVLGYLNFFDLRRLNQVNRYYRRKLNAEFRRLYPRDDPRDQFWRMLQQVDRAALQWLIRRDTWRELKWMCEDRITLSWLISTKNVALIRAWTEEGFLPMKVELATYWLREFDSAEEELKRAIGDLLIKLGVEHLKFFRYPSNLYRYSRSTLEWIHTHVPGTWDQNSDCILQLCLSGKPEVFEWVEEQGLFNWSQILPTLTPNVIFASKNFEFFSWLETRYRLNFAPSYDYLFEFRHYNRLENAVVSWLGARHYQPPKDWLISLCHCGEPKRLTLYLPLYRTQVALLQSILSTQDYRYPPYSPAVYSLISQYSI